MPKLELTNPAERPILEAARLRYSPYRFLDQTVEREKLLRCFEAARWAASSFNDQPWSWLVATRDQTDDFDKMLSCLLEANQGWAKHAPVLVLTTVRTAFSYNGKPNRVAVHDLGQAACLFSLQAADLGLQVHQMAGINLSLIKQKYAIPEGHEPQTAMAIGYPDASAPASDQAEQMADRETSARRRKPLAEQVFADTFGRPAPMVD